MDRSHQDLDHRTENQKLVLNTTGVRMTAKLVMYLHVSDEEFTYIVHFTWFGFMCQQQYNITFFTVSELNFVKMIL